MLRGLGCGRTPTYMLTSSPKLHLLSRRLHLFSRRNWQPSFSLSRSRSLWTWGAKDFGRGGIGFEEGRSPLTSPLSVPLPDQPVPTVVTQPKLAQSEIKQIVCGGAHTLLLNTSGLLYSCGLGEQGQLGHCTFETLSKFEPVDMIDDVVYAAAGFYHSAAVNRVGEVFTWGLNSNSQLGVLKDAIDPSEGKVGPPLTPALTPFEPD